MAAGQELATPWPGYRDHWTRRPSRWQMIDERERVGVMLPGDSYAAVDQLNTQIVAFARAVVAACGADPRLVPTDESAEAQKAMHDALASYPPKTFSGGGVTYSSGPGGYLQAAEDSHAKLKAAGKLGDFWYDEVQPFLTEWQGFHRDHSHAASFFTQLATGSDVYHTWQERLETLRKKAIALGVKLPADAVGIPQSSGLIDQLEHALGDVGTKVLIGAAVLGGVAVIVELAGR